MNVEFQYINMYNVVLRCACCASQESTLIQLLCILYMYITVNVALHCLVILYKVSFQRVCVALNNSATLT